VVQRDVVQIDTKGPAVVTQSPAQIPLSASPEKAPERPQLIYAERGTRAFHALHMVWPLVCWRLERCPNITSAQLFEELCAQFPGRFHPWHDRRLMKRVKAWRRDARARGVVIGPRKHRYPTKRARGQRVYPDRLKDHWPEMLKCLEDRPDQTAKELLVEFQMRYPGFYNASNLRTLRRRVQEWRRVSGVNWHCRRRLSFLPVLRLHQRSTVGPSDAGGVRGSVRYMFNGIKDVPGAQLSS
jgi:hypothetical protein